MGGVFERRHLFRYIRKFFKISYITKNAALRIALKLEGSNEKMRLDKYLKVSRLIKRRTVANEACDAGRVLINDKPAKASVNVKVGDIIEIQFGTRNVKVQVTSIAETVKKEEAKEMYKDI